VVRKSSLEVWKSEVTKLMLIFLNFYVTHDLRRMSSSRLEGTWEEHLLHA
jgi:hypothetical protein